MATVDPRYFDFGGRFQEGMQQGRQQRLQDIALGQQQEDRSMRFEDRQRAIAGEQSKAATTAEESKRKKLLNMSSGLVRAFEVKQKTGNEAPLKGFWNAIRPELAKDFGQDPGEWDDSNIVMAYQIMAQSGGDMGGGSGQYVKAQKIGDDGFIYNTMSDGAMINTGIKADRQAWLRDLPGLGPQIVGKSGDITPVAGAPVKQTAAQEALDVGRAKMAVEKEGAKPKAKLTLDQATARTNRIDSLVDQIIPRVDVWTSGFVGRRLSELEGTEAHDLKKDIGTLQAIAGFDELAAMRAASPTGGALGSVTERELQFLQSVVRNIENSQSPEQLKRNLQYFKGEIKDSWERVRQAYEQDFGQTNQPATPGAAPSQPAGQSGPSISNW